MTKKDYVEIAGAIDLATVSYDHEIVVKISLVERLSSIFKEDNPRFDAERFMKACSKD